MLVILSRFSAILELLLSLKLIGIRVAYWCGPGTPLRWVQNHQWKWATTGDLSKLLGTFFSLHLGLQNVDQFLVDKVNAKLKY